MAKLHTPISRGRASMIGGNSAEIPELPIRIFGTAGESIVDGPGMRYVIFVQGCPHGCPGCHNPESHDINGGKLTTTAELWRDIERYPLTTGITFSGGEPFLWARELSKIGKKARERGMNVMTYTGYLWEDLLEMAESDENIRELLTVTNYLVDGPFILEKRDLTLLYRGSGNQRILDITCYPNSRNAAPAFER